MKNNAFQNPTQRQLILFTLAGITGILLLVLSMTDLFTSSFFQREYLLLYFIIAGALITLSKMHINYWQKTE